LIGIGFSGPKVPLNRIPGWEPESYAYHGDDGQIFNNNTQGKPFGQKFGTLDVVGCGINFRTGQAFFTRNGVMLGEYIMPMLLIWTDFSRYRFQGPED
jgi:hypothetical protein